MSKDKKKKKRGGKKKMIALGILCILIGIVVIYWNISYSPYKSEFNNKMHARMNEITSYGEVCTSEEIEKLPEPLKRFCEYIGLEGTPKYQAINVMFNDTKFVFDDKSGKILDMIYDLWLFYDEGKVFRSAYCESSMYGVPFDGMDYCTDNFEGGMRGILGKAIPIFDVHTEQGYQAGVISWFAESLAFNPCILFGDAVEYEVIDANHVKVKITKNGVSGTGKIYIDDNGAVREFYSEERQVENIDGKDVRIGWRCEYDDYEEKDGKRMIGTVRGIKVYPDKEVVYFDSEDFTIKLCK